MSSFLNRHTNQPTRVNISSSCCEYTCAHSSILVHLSSVAADIKNRRIIVVVKYVDVDGGSAAERDGGATIMSTHGQDVVVNLKCQWKCV